MVPSPSSLSALSFWRQEWRDWHGERGQPTGQRRRWTSGRKRKDFFVIVVVVVHCVRCRSRQQKDKTARKFKPQIARYNLALEHPSFPFGYFSGTFWKLLMNTLPWFFAWSSPFHYKGKSADKLIAHCIVYFRKKKQGSDWDIFILKQK